MTVTCDHLGCEYPMTWRAYASYNADAGQNAHPLHARYPMPMVRACDMHLGVELARDADFDGPALSPSTRQWLVVRP